MELSRYFQAYVTRLQALQVDGIAMGSNTLCAVARDHGWPASAVPIIDMIAPTARAVAATGKTNIGVLATSATVRSGVYGAAVRRAVPGARVHEVAASELVDYVEKGIVDGVAITETLRKARSGFPAPIDLLVLGCTHFPWLQRAIEDQFGPGVELLDPAHAVAHEVALRRKVPHRDEANEAGVTRFLTTGDARAFEQNLTLLMGPLREGDEVVQVAPVNL
ncbi:glutamate racemase [Dyella telluris]|uniref:Aspartate/glutamate racemase family protein n=1 Tax=Dyella telluris TaxID=2763498 RepID=A0A7G8Q1Q9_9GAMM|nr:aspartate/glutamate racemase family protein [Dyella telluris]QNK00717.1 aspartate/glutamate racemase family protein [Dyella telluris]